MRETTARQQKVLDFIRDHINSQGMPPTLREIGLHMRIRSTNGVNDHLRALERKGYIVRRDMTSRGIRLTELAGPSPVPIPLPVPPPAPPDTVEPKITFLPSASIESGHRDVVYFAQCLDTAWIKIGWSAHVSDRVRALRGAGNVVLLATMPGNRDTEVAMHRQFRSFRIRGEWFRPSPPLVEFIMTVRQDYVTALYGEDEPESEDGSHTLANEDH